MLRPEKLIEWAEEAEGPLGFNRAGAMGQLKALGLTPASALVLAGGWKALEGLTDEQLDSRAEIDGDGHVVRVLFCEMCVQVDSHLENCPVQAGGAALADFAALGKEK